MLVGDIDAVRVTCCMLHIVFNMCILNSGQGLTNYVIECMGGAFDVAYAYTLNCHTMMTSLTCATNLSIYSVLRHTHGRVN